MMNYYSTTDIPICHVHMFNLMYVFFSPWWATQDHPKDMDPRPKCMEALLPWGMAALHLQDGAPLHPKWALPQACMAAHRLRDTGPHLDPEGPRRPNASLPLDQPDSLHKWSGELLQPLLRDRLLPSPDCSNAFEKTPIELTVQVTSRASSRAATIIY